MLRHGIHKRAGGQTDRSEPVKIEPLVAVVDKGPFPGENRGFDGFSSHFRAVFEQIAKLDVEDYEVDYFSECRDLNGGCLRTTVLYFV